MGGSPVDSQPEPDGGVTKPPAVQAPKPDREAPTKPADDTPDAAAPSEVFTIEPDKSGPYPVGTRRVEIKVGSRTLPVQLWYPAVEAARAQAMAGVPLENIEPPGERHDTLAALVAKAPDGCTNKTMHAANAPAAFQREEPWPTVLFSHCLDCTRYSDFSSAEHIASWGFVVAAPDHEGGTLYDAQAGTSAGMTPEFLEVRAQDITGVIDVLIDEKSTAVPKDLRGKIDAQNLGVFGHAYGAVTAGLVLQNDERVRAGVLVAAPIETPKLGKVSIAKITQPSLFILAREDNSISEADNLALRNNYENYPNEAWLLEVIDAGHWTFSDVCGLVEEFQAGCGEGTRQSSLVTDVKFTYLDNEIGRGIGKAYTLAYFGRELTEDPVAGEYLKLPKPSQYVTIRHHK